MGKHRKARVAKLNRTLAIGAVAGATAMGFGALSSVNAPEAHADWWALIAGPGSGNASGNDTLAGNGTGNGNGNFGNNNLFIGGQNGNGNTTQTTWGAGNNMNTQTNLFSPVTGGSATNNGNVTATGGSSTATSSPTTTGNDNNTGQALGNNTATSTAGNVGGALAQGTGGSNTSTQTQTAISYQQRKCNCHQHQPAGGCGSALVPATTEAEVPSGTGGSQTNARRSTRKPPTQTADGSTNCDQPADRGVCCHCQRQHDADQPDQW